MSATAADLIPLRGFSRIVEDVLPPVDLRQWVLTVPFAWRKRLGYDPLEVPDGGRRPSRLGAHANLREDGARLLPRAGRWTSTRTEWSGGGGAAHVFRSEAEPARARGVSRRDLSRQRRSARLPCRWAPVETRCGGGTEARARPDGEVASSSGPSLRGRRLRTSGQRFSSGGLSERWARGAARPNSHPCARGGPSPAQVADPVRRWV